MLPLSGAAWITRRRPSSSGARRTSGITPTVAVGTMAVLVAASVTVGSGADVGAGPGAQAASSEETRPILSSLRGWNIDTVLSSEYSVIVARHGPRASHPVLL